MFRIAMCLLIAFASASVAARDVKMSSPNGGSCPNAAAEKAQARYVSRKAAPSGDTKVKPGLHSDSASPGRLQSPRWHSFLPGMFR